VGDGDKVGPDLLGVTKRHADSWLTSWLIASEILQKSDPAAKKLLSKYKVPMPNQGLSPNAARELVKYFHWFDQAGRSMKTAESSRHETSRSN
jgi:nitrite reductase (NO-forming)